MVLDGLDLLQGSVESKFGLRSGRRCMLACDVKPKWPKPSDEVPNVKSEPSDEAPFLVRHFWSSSLEEGCKKKERKYT